MARRAAVCAGGGLSPRMRGNLSLTPPELQSVGSIPAHAGEPKTMTSCRGSLGVYPRACGGTARQSSQRIQQWGLSPRMRGNRGARAPRWTPSGSIPAHAGEPGLGPCPRQRSRVYPRACGGTAGCKSCDLSQTGLSPRMRGNPRRWPEGTELSGSIPAHAGEPRGKSSRWYWIRVYPRACGGTWAWAIWACLGLGLSPRMRGNLSASATHDTPLGSIPAHAGEPRQASSRRRRCRVYPRACGGTCIGHNPHWSS